MPPSIKSRRPWTHCSVGQPKSPSLALMVVVVEAWAPKADVHRGQTTGSLVGKRPGARVSQWYVCISSPSPVLMPSRCCYDEKINVHRPVLKYFMWSHLFNRYLICNTLTPFLLHRLRRSQMLTGRQHSRKLFQPVEYAFVGITPA